MDKVQLKLSLYHQWLHNTCKKSQHIQCYFLYYLGETASTRLVPSLPSNKMHTQTLTGLLSLSISLCLPARTHTLQSWLQLISPSTTLMYSPLPTKKIVKLISLPNFNF